LFTHVSAVTTELVQTAIQQIDNEHNNVVAI